MGKCTHNWFHHEKAIIKCASCGADVLDLILEQDKENQRLRQQLHAERRLIETLTPGGSEFHNNVEACVNYALETKAENHRIFIDHVSRRLAVEAVNAELCGVLRKVSNGYEGRFLDYGKGNPAEQFREGTLALVKQALEAPPACEVGELVRAVGEFIKSTTKMSNLRPTLENVIHAYNKVVSSSD